MKTLTIKAAQNIPILSSYIIEVDGKKIGLLKPGETAYFDIEEDAKSIVAKMQGAKTNFVDISENIHYSLIINYKKQVLNSVLLFIAFLLLCFGINYYIKLELMYLIMIQIVLAFILYTIFKKTRLNTLQLSLIKKSSI